MKYVKDASQRGFYYLIAGIISLLFPAVSHWLVFSRHSVPTMVIVIFWMVGLFVGLLMTRQAIKMIRSDAKWIITIGHHGIDWQSPDESVDISFQYSLDQMNAVEFNTLSGPSAVRSKHRYFIVKSDGSRQSLSPASGLSPKTVLDELAAVGVPVIHTRD